MNDPYAPPRARVVDSPSHAIAPPLWNPNAAANWSLLFSPAFGAYLHMLNWRALGETSRAATAKTWFIVSVALLAIGIAVDLVLPDGSAANAGANSFAVVYLLVWYFASARRQSRYVADKWDGDYPRRPWKRPLLVATAGLLGYAIVAFAVYWALPSRA